MLFSGQSIHFTAGHAGQESCQLCQFISETLEAETNTGRSIEVHRAGVCLVRKPDGHRLLRLCAGLELPKEPAGGPLARSEELPISFPDLPPPEDILRFDLLQAWLDQCCCEPFHDTPRNYLPTRLLDVSNPNVLRLIPGEKIGDKRYIVLSHCWGKLGPEEVPPYCTTRHNICVREGESGFADADLPLTFLDAVKVARALSIRYLWIDSLCIIQQDPEDWQREAMCMEQVYSSAYLTIAATSATNSESGFLKRNASSKHVYIQDDLGRRAYICNTVADFDHEVEKAQLNTRAWVLQERMLSRRTIHFGSHQMYFECGEAVYCEDLTRMTCLGGEKYFKLDPEFPNRLRSSGFGDTIHFLQSFLADYSKRGHTKPTDRAIAVSGLAARISSVLPSAQSYGVFGLFLHRTLLWGGAGQQRMEKIEYTSSHKPPSWSWMAYKGGIQFLGGEFGELDLFLDLQLKGSTLNAVVWKFRDCNLQEVSGTPLKRQILAPSAGEREEPEERGWVMYDVEDDNNLGLERAVIVARKYCGKRCYMLVVKQVGRSKYERVGVGEIEWEWVWQKQTDVVLV
ncbi:heterokaryon incompatibility protein-domain-containing protein [Lasiosphaeris hirsuta]|uniref:Heterokaryon incompatibility protein-domain-containing protein n=1 Tax=Lasiosphaeris hirsuta TaxID=260670 RepID=A0AA39ZPH3_9PEZI|nr:heterokaryon incompatibility protein-domain-containing protein [Lasiosphaeris hirsuta]